MTDNKESKDWSLDHALRYIYINEVIFVTLVMLCFIGELVAEFADRGVVLFYWLCMTPIFFICSLISEKVKSLKTGVKKPHLMRIEILYWGSAMTAVILIFLLWHAESIQAGAAAMSIHIILAHTLFLSGIVLGVQYYLVGIFLFITAALTIFMSGTFGIDLVLMLPVIGLGFYLEKQYLFPTLKRTHDFTQEISDLKKAQDNKDNA
ncbi:MAG: hypothetical protein QM500_20135 [Methylococcales bacterium]